MSKFLKYVRITSNANLFDDYKITTPDTLVDNVVNPLVIDDLLNFVIDNSTGIIENWPVGISMKTWFKLRDEGNYELLDDDKNSILTITDSYVPDIICENGGGDYLEFDIDENGKIKNWNVLNNDLIECYLLTNNMTDLYNKYINHVKNNSFLLELSGNEFVNITKFDGTIEDLEIYLRKKYSQELQSGIFTIRKNKINNFDGLVINKNIEFPYFQSLYYLIK